MNHPFYYKTGNVPVELTPSQAGAVLNFISALDPKKVPAVVKRAVTKIKESHTIVEASRNFKL